jgi:alpha-tubulin suppressor-like RCC1 family protein
MRFAFNMADPVRNTAAAILTGVKAIAAGTYDNVVLLSNGTVSVWGDASDAGSTNLVGLSSVKAIASGWEHNVALLSNGTVAVWGLSVLNITNIPAGLSNVVAIAAGGHHTLALRADGTIVAWGAGQTNGGYLWDQGQSLVPGGLSNAVAIAAGGYSSIVLKNDGTAVGWGEVSSTAEGFSGVGAIGAGDGHCLAIRTGRQTPVLFQQPATQVVGVGASVTFTVSAAAPATLQYQCQFNGTNITEATNATLTLASVQATNLGFYRVLISNGAGTTYSQEARLSFIPPPAILSMTPPEEQRLLYGDTLSLSVQATTPGFPTNAVSYQWSLNGQWFYSPDGTNITAPLFSRLPPFYYYATNYDGVYSVLITNAGGSTNVSWTIRIAGEGAPVWWGSTTQAWDYLPGVKDTLALARGGDHSLLLHESGTVLAWGTNDYGQTDVPMDLMDAPMNGGAATGIAAGAAHSLALKSNQTVVAWGRNDFNQTNVPANLTNVMAISAGGHQSLALRQDSTVVQWGQTNAPVPTGLTNVNAIASGTNFHLALLKNSTVVAWGANNHGQTNVPANLSNVVAIAAGGAHALALRENGTVIVWGANGSGQTNVPAALTNAMGVAAGYAHSIALRNDGTVLVWGDNTYGQTNTPALKSVKLLAAGGNQTLAGIFSPLVQYPVDVSRELLLIYNTNSAASIWVKDYYLAHRPMVAGAMTLGISCASNEVSGQAIITSESFTNEVLVPYQNWLTQNPTKRPQYVLWTFDLPGRVEDTNGTVYASPSYYLYTAAPGIPPFVTCINMRTTNDCEAYIDKLAAFGTNDSIFISASKGGYDNTNYFFDDTENGYGGSGVGLSGVEGVIQNGASSNSVVYTNVYPDCGSLACHITVGTNVAGYLSWGGHSYLWSEYATNGYVRWFGNSSWWIIQTVESYNGQRDNPNTGQGNFLQWFSANAFGGTNYSNTPVGAVSHVEEPYAIANDPFIYFGSWSAGKRFAICAWISLQRPKVVQAVGDPFVHK